MDLSPKIKTKFSLEIAVWNKLRLLDAASPIKEQITVFHDHTILIVVIITILVGYLIISLFPNLYINRFSWDGQMLETIWTILQAITFVFIALASQRLLYLTHEIIQATVTIKAIGHEWYWRYEYSEFSLTEFDLYIYPRNEIIKKFFRLLDLDNRVILPINMIFEFLLQQQMTYIHELYLH